MYKNIILIICFVCVGVSFGASNFMYETQSKYSVNDTVKRIEIELKKRKIPVFAKFDHSKNAKDVKLELRDTTVIVFGDPSVGTKLMQENQLIAIELPLKILVWQNEKNLTMVGFIKPAYMADKYGMGKNPIIGKMQTLLESIVQESVK